MIVQLMYFSTAPDPGSDEIIKLAPYPILYSCSKISGAQNCWTQLWPSNIKTVTSNKFGIPMSISHQKIWPCSNLFLADANRFYLWQVNIAIVLRQDLRFENCWAPQIYLSFCDRKNKSKTITALQWRISTDFSQSP